MNLLRLGKCFKHRGAELLCTTCGSSGRPGTQFVENRTRKRISTSTFPKRTLIVVGKILVFTYSGNFIFEGPRL